MAPALNSKAVIGLTLLSLCGARLCAQDRPDRPRSRPVAATGTSHVGPRTSALEDGAPTYAIKRTEPTTLVYLEHDGPYWRLGPLVQQVSEIAAAEGLTGDLFVRYPGDPLSPRAAGGPIHVGIVVTGEPPDLPPFKEQRRAPELVAFTITTLPASRATRLFSTLRTWALRRGYSALGPLMEIHRAQTSAETDGARSIEIQMPVRPLIEPARAELNAAAGGAAPMPLDHTDTQSVPVDHAAESGLNEETHAESANVDAPMETVASEGTDDAGTAIASAYELMSSGAFDRLAAQAIPDGMPLNDAEHAWLGRVVLRVEAIGAGVRKVYPDADDALTRVASALRGRYQEVSAARDGGSASQGAVRVDAPDDDGRAAIRGRLIRALDVLMGRIAFRTVDAGQAAQALADVLDGIAETVRDETETVDDGN